MEDCGKAGRWVGDGWGWFRGTKFSKFVSGKADDTWRGIKGIFKKNAYEIAEGVGKAIKAPTYSGGDRNAMLKIGPKPFEGAQAHHVLPWKFKDWFAE